MTGHPNAAVGPQLFYNRLKNWLQTLLIVGALAVVTTIPGWILAGQAGVVWSLALVATTAYLSGRIPARLILARSGAGPLHRRHAPALYDILDELYHRAGIHTEPALFYLPSPALNAFAVGDRRNGGIALSDGLLRSLDLRQLAGVLAHEVSHLRHNDTRVMSMAAVMTELTLSAATLLQLALLLMLPWVLTGELSLPWLALVFVALAPSVSILLQLALSRNREFTADLEAVALTGDPRGLASALQHLERHEGSWAERLFGPRSRSVPRWLHTHPLTSERIARLMALDPQRGAAGLLSSRHGVSDRFFLRQRPDPLGGRYWILRRR